MDEERETKALAHAEEYLKIYQEIGPNGAFGAMMIQKDIDDFKRAKENGWDTEAIVNEMEGIK